MDDNKTFGLGLYLQEGIGNVGVKKSLEKYKSIDNLAKNYKNPVDLERARRLHDNLAKLAINCCFSWEEAYPDKLKEIYDLPFIIFYKGDLNPRKFEKCISIVGTRSLTSYGKKYAYEISYELSKQGFSIVSGLASGVDSVAHTAALDANATTIAVLAGSVERSIPASNWKLYQRILNSGGIILSEFAPGTKILPGLFASRNRIIAGLSVGTVIIEAGEKSGSLITADLALNYGRDVFALPGNVSSTQSFGCNNLIKDSKAKLIQGAYDVLEEYGYTPNIIKKKEELDLKDDERKFYDILLNGDKNIEEISKALNIQLNNVISLSLNLELQGLIKKDFLGKYSLIK